MKKELGRAAFFPIALIWLGIFAMHFATFNAMAQVWSISENYSHGWLIAPISGVLAWKYRHRAEGLPVEPQYIVGCLMLAAACAVWMVGEVARVSSVKQFAVVAMIPISVYLTLGRHYFHVFRFPLLFLFCMVPAGEGLTNILMDLTAAVTVGAVQASGIPIFREGMHFTLPTGRWSVVEACSGLRYLIAALVLAILFAHMHYDSLKKKIMFFVAAIAVSIVANWVRAYMIVMVGHFSNMKYGVGDDHVWYGWVFFGLVMALTFWIGVKYGDKTDFFATENASTRIADVHQNKVQKATSVAYVSASVGIALIAAFLPIPNLVETNQTYDQLNSKMQVDGFSSGKTAFAFRPGFMKSVADFEQNNSEGESIYLSYFARQRQLTDMLAWNQHFIDENGAAKIVSAPTKVNESFLSWGALNEYVVRDAGREVVVWQWFSVGPYQVGHPYLAKVARVFSAFFGYGDHSMVVAIAVPRVANAPDQARAALRKIAPRVAIKAVGFTSNRPLPPGPAANNQK